ncbi:efflux RND transporter permease subunit [Burkholderia multivorans]|uniref:efflux RND transporter permease subunit n=1 Tax=Burkholderia multivorans TaxID=87883 RepID=UPI001C268D1B|nr:efflux RND transporter permease subunit [Burkholderia multivorans]MBU9597655.1 MMPL family transporter [Burkholderia multivorans]MDN8000955.1 efflux RND transporter permease subunit [Burkholderia multivorans]
MQTGSSSPYFRGFVTAALNRTEQFIFANRVVILIALGIFTVAMAFFATKLRMDAGFEKQMPTSHEYIRTFDTYKNDVIGANRLTVVVKARHGTIWNRAALARLYSVTQAVVNLPGVIRPSVQSLWTPNTFVNVITEDGFRADPLISSTVTPDTLPAEDIDGIQRAASQGGFIGTLVARDQSSAMITADLNEVDGSGKKLDYIALNHLIEKQVRQPFEDTNYEIQIIGFAKQIGDIADGAGSVLSFCGIALLLTAAAVYWYSRSVRLTILPVVCSLTSLIWQFGTLRLLGYGLDPLAVLVPFLVFAIGVSHGVQQINHIVRELSHGKTTEQAARSSFTGLLIPGTLALVTAFVSFITLALIPIPMVKELAITASIGVGYKIVTNLVMLPLAASTFHFTQEYARKAMALREARGIWLKRLARVAEPRNAAWALAVVAVVFGVSIWQSRDRVIGTLQPGAPELRANARFNRDAVAITSSYDTGLDWLTVFFKAPPDSCGNPALGMYQDKFVRQIQHVDGVISVDSYANMLRTYNEGYNEGNPKMFVIPVDPENYGALSAEIARVSGYMRKDCSMVAANLFLSDHKATTITHVIDEINRFKEANSLAGVQIELAGGNAGVLAAVDDEIAKSELPMMLYVYAAIIILVFLVYRDFRAVIACCLPLTVGTFIGYWFMKELKIGLTVATLPVMVLAVGIGVDYAFYIYNRLNRHLADGQTITKATEYAMLEVGVATVFTAITMAIGVATWSFSALKFQADMGKLLAFMFMINLVMAMTALPALAVWLERLFPRKQPVRASSLLEH